MARWLKNAIITVVCNYVWWGGGTNAHYCCCLPSLIVGIPACNITICIAPEWVGGQGTKGPRSYTKREMLRYL